MSTEIHKIANQDDLRDAKENGLARGDLIMMKNTLSSNLLGSNKAIFLEDLSIRDEFGILVIELDGFSKNNTCRIFYAVDADSADGIHYRGRFEGDHLEDEAKYAEAIKSLGESR